MPSHPGGERAANEPADVDDIFHGVRIALKAVDDAIRPGDVRHAIFAFASRLERLRLSGFRLSELLKEALKP